VSLKSSVAEPALDFGDARAESPHARTLPRFEPEYAALHCATLRVIAGGTEQVLFPGLERGRVVAGDAGRVAELVVCRIQPLFVAGGMGYRPLERHRCLFGTIEVDEAQATQVVGFGHSRLQPNRRPEGVDGEFVLLEATIGPAQAEMDLRIVGFNL